MFRIESKIMRHTVNQEMWTIFNRKDNQQMQLRADSDVAIIKKTFMQLLNYPPWEKTNNLNWRER